MVEEQQVIEDQGKKILNESRQKGQTMSKDDY